MFPKFSLSMKGFGYFQCRNLSTSNDNLDSTGQILFSALSRVWLSLHRFLRNSELLNDIACRSPILNFNQIGQEMWQVEVELIYAID